jgi:hypothetical protein
VISLTVAKTHAIPISLEPYLNWKGVTWQEKGITGQVDPLGSSIPGEAFPNGAFTEINNIPFIIPKTDSIQDDMVSCEGQHIDLGEPHHIQSIQLLGFSTFGDYSDDVSLVYEDGTIQVLRFALTDWFQYAPDKSALFGEELGIEIPYFLDEDEKVERSTAVWLQRIPCKPNHTLKQIQLPENSLMFILAITLIKI